MLVKKIQPCGMCGEKKVENAISLCDICMDQMRHRSGILYSDDGGGHEMCEIAKMAVLRLVKNTPLDKSKKIELLVDIQQTILKGITDLSSKSE